jgi:acyl-CoA thioesterase
MFVRHSSWISRRQQSSWRLLTSTPSISPHSSYFFDQELAKIEKINDNQFYFPLSNQWSITTIPNGGFLSALAIKCSRQVISHGNIISLSSHFYNRTIENEQAEITVEILSTTKSTSTVLTTLSQHHKKRCSFLCTFSFKKSNPFQFILDTSPALPPRTECQSASVKLRKQTGDMLRIAERVDFWVPSDSTYIDDIATGGGSEGQRSDIHTSNGRLECWLRYSDDRPITLTSLAFLNDCLPPPILAMVGFKNHWVPTVEYSVQFWGIPSPAPHHHQSHQQTHADDPNESLLIGQGADPWVRAQFLTNHVENGTLSTDSQIWSSDGKTLLANARQLAKLVTVS